MCFRFGIYIERFAVSIKIEAIQAMYVDTDSLICRSFMASTVFGKSLHFLMLQKMLLV